MNSTIFTIGVFLILIIALVARTKLNVKVKCGFATLEVTQNFKNEKSNDCESLPLGKK